MAGEFLEGGDGNAPIAGGLEQKTLVGGSGNDSIYGKRRGQRPRGYGAGAATFTWGPGCGQA